MDKIIEMAPGVLLSCKSDLEEWRGTTFQSKEPETIAWLDTFLITSGEQRVFFDVGANIGIYSLYAAAIYDCNVYAFEPVLENFTRIEVNRQLNKCTNLYAFQLAVSDKLQLNDLYIRDLRIGNSGAQIGAPVDELGRHFEPIAARKVLSVSLDTLVYEFGFPFPHLLKIDIDGLEHLVLCGAVKLLAHPQVLSILVEVNTTTTAVQIIHLMSQLGFKRDISFESLDRHSSKRRRQNAENNAENIIFSRLS